jgi:hypothetical protein
MKAIGYARVSTEKQADFGVSLEAQAAKVRAMAVVQGAELVDVLVDAGESAKSLNRPAMARLLALVDSGAVDTVIIAKLDRLTRSVADLAELLKRFERRGVSLVSVADSLDTRSAARQSTVLAKPWRIGRPRFVGHVGVSHFSGPRGGGLLLFRLAPLEHLPHSRLPGGSRVNLILPKCVTVYPGRGAYAAVPKALAYRGKRYSVTEQL